MFVLHNSLESFQNVKQLQGFPEKMENAKSVKVLVEIKVTIMQKETVFLLWKKISKKPC
jgi:hypothetical protein